MEMLLFGDPLCSALAMLAEEAIAEHHHQQQRQKQQQHSGSIPSQIKKITFRVGPKKPMKSAATAANEVGSSSKSETSNIKKHFEQGSSSISSTSIPSHIKKITFHLGGMKNVVLVNDDEAKGKAETTSSSSSSSSKKPIITFMDSAEEEYKDDDHVLRMKKGKGLKRTHETFINDAVDGEWVPGESSSSSKTKKHKKQKKSLTEAEPSALPQEFIDRINEMGGTEITKVFSKVLYQTDLTKQANRLLMPFRKIKNAGFLREGELQDLKAKMQVPFIQPSLQLTNLTLTLWDMSKDNGSTNYYYALITNWKNVVDANQLKEGDFVQVWSFRVQEELHMALVKV